jgi:RNA polymerase sigma-70 factor (ECF subfamily)
MARRHVTDQPDPEERFEALYARYYRQVLGYVLRRAPTPIAADVVAEVFVVAWRRLQELPEEPLPWLLGVARKTLANERRGSRRRAALLDVLRETGVSESGDEMWRDKLAQPLAEAFDRLSGTDRELVSLIAWDGLTTREVAQALGISHAACRVRLHRARRRLARQLAQGSEGEHGSAATPRQFKAREEI